MGISKFSKLKEVTSCDVVTDKSLSNMLMRTIQVCVYCYGYCFSMVTMITVRLS